MFTQGNRVKGVFGKVRIPMHGLSGFESRAAAWKIEKNQKTPVHPIALLPGSPGPDLATVCEDSLPDRLARHGAPLAARADPGRPLGAGR